MTGESMETIREKAISSVIAWAGSREAALVWLSRPLPSFGGKSPEDLIAQGRGDALLAHIERIGSGGFA